MEKSDFAKLVSRWNHKRKMKVQARRLTQQMAPRLKFAPEGNNERVQAALSFLQPKSCGIELIRIGPDNDGGYLLPNDLEDIAALFSPGVSDTLGFDVEIARRGIPCFLADASVSPPTDLLENMEFIQKFIGASDDNSFITMEAWMSGRAPENHDLMLQMDIEGAEYDVLSELTEEQIQRFRIIVIEFHHLHEIFDAEHAKAMTRVFEKLSRTHVPCHVHANNVVAYFEWEGLTVPPVIEVSYIRKDRVKKLGEAQIPHPLDQCNNPKLPDVPTPAFWQANP